MPSSRPTKRQRREQPITPLDHESVACVASSKGPIHSPIVSKLDKEIILERLKKEIVETFDLKLSVPRGSNSKNNKMTKTTSAITTAETRSGSTTKEREKSRRSGAATSLKSRIIDSRLRIGINECTRALENHSCTNQDDDSKKSSSSGVVQLILLCHDVHPPTMVAHIPFLAAAAASSSTTTTDSSIPLLILPGGHASLELGHVLGIPRATILVIRRQQQELQEALQGGNNDDTTMARTFHEKIDSFVEFVKRKASTNEKGPK